MFGYSGKWSPFDRHVLKDSLNIVRRLKLDAKLQVHTGCVNTISWDERGMFLVSGSDDLSLVITNPFERKVVTRVRTSHKANIFSAKFMPATNNAKIASCSGDGHVLWTDVEKATSELSYNNAGFHCHVAMAYEVVTAPGDAHTFMSCGEDCTVRWFDVRRKSFCLPRRPACEQNMLLDLASPITSMDVNPAKSYELAVATADGLISVYDRRVLGLRGSSAFNEKPVPVGQARALRASSMTSTRLTCVRYSPNGRELLGSYSSDRLYLFDTMRMEQRTEVDSDEAQQSMRDRRFRLRGDWSDTGPSSRPLSEIGASEDEQRRRQLRDIVHTQLLMRMARWYQDIANPLGAPPREHGESGSETGASASTPVNLEAALRAEEEKVAKQEKEAEAKKPTALGAPFSPACTRRFAEIASFGGHRNGRTMIKECCFWGDNFIVSGSDCGHIFVWDKRTQEIVNVLLGDQHVVNCVQPHPNMPILAASGIDYDIKLFYPLRESPEVDLEKVEALVRRNDRMLEDTRNTISIPFACFLRMMLDFRRHMRNENDEPRGQRPDAMEVEAESDERQREAEAEAEGERRRRREEAEDRPDPDDAGSGDLAD